MRLSALSTRTRTSNTTNDQDQSTFRSINNMPNHQLPPNQEHRPA